MTELVGYLDRWSTLAGETVDVRLSSNVATSVSLGLVRLGRGDLRDEADGIAHEPVPQVPLQTLAVRPQRVDAGSFAEIIGLEPLDLASGTLALLVQPWTVAGAEQTVLALCSGLHSLCVMLDASGAFGLRTGPDFAAVKSWHAPPRRWVVLHLVWTVREATLILQTCEGQDLGRASCLRQAAGERFDRLTLAGMDLSDGTVGSHFDGRLERPVLWAGRSDVTASQARSALLEASGLPVEASACWDFAQAMDGQAITDIGPHRLHGRLHQGPKRAVRGARWNGQVFDWRQAPDHYAAIHFHRDDLIDAGWEVDARIELPASLPPGIYAVRAVCEGTVAGDALTRGIAMLPLFVRASTAEVSLSGVRVAVVFPTFTYLAYANDRTVLFGHNPEVLAARAVTLEPTEVLLSRHPEWGLSLYDTHQDGSGVSLASRWRPIPALHPDQRAWQAGEGSGRWNFPGDLLLVEWLEREEIAWHPLTDEDLQTGGASVLAPYSVVLTGNHPEYSTPQLIDAYRNHLRDGGRLMYLGGNGFYWKVACSLDLPGVIELRRAEDGNRSWAEEPGEYFHAFDGTYGGLWRRNGLTPQSWLGVGYSGQGFRRSTGYVRTADSDRKEVSYVFEGVPQRVFGERGAIGGGCAGIEVDRHDLLLGSNPEGFLLATSQPFDSTYFVANEEMLVSRPTISAEFSSAVRADIVLQHKSTGGAVFSTGSIAWVGGLHPQQGDLIAQRVMKNVLQRFLDPTPFVLPQLGDTA